LLVQLGGVGVPVIDPGATWRRASEGKDGQVYDALLSPEGFKVQSRRPLVSRDSQDPKLMHIVVGDDAVGQKHLRQFLSGGKFRVLSTERVRVDDPVMGLDFGFNPELKLAALKMAFAAATLSFPNEVASFATARRELATADLSRSPSCVAGDLRHHSALDRLRDPLCHVIYVEQQARGLQAIVQFFGSLQFWAELTPEVSGTYDKAMMATLDPVTGVEQFNQITPLGLPRFLEGVVVDALLPIKKLNSGAAKRGGKTHEMISVKRVHVDGVEVAPKPYLAISWTGDIPRRRS